MAILKGVHPPLTWSLTQALEDYSQGFAKRGLLGSIYEAAGISHSRSLTLVFAAEFLLFMVFIGILSWRSGLEEKVGGAAVVAIFTSSYAITFITNLLGYTDIVLATITIALLLIASPSRRFYIGLPGIALAVLIHENFVLLFLPCLLFSFLVDAAFEPDPVRRRRIFLLSAITLVATVGLTLLVAIAGNISPEQMVRLQARMHARADFPLRTEFYAVLQSSFADNLRMGCRRFLTFRWYGVLGLAIMLMGPAMAGIVAVFRRLLKTQRSTISPKWIGILSVAYIAALLSPELLNFIGIDAMRWHAYTLVAAYLCLCCLTRRLSGTTNIRLDAADMRWVFVIIIINVASGYGLYDHYLITPYPYFPTLLGLN